MIQFIYCLQIQFAYHYPYLGYSLHFNQLLKTSSFENIRIIESGLKKFYRWRVDILIFYFWGRNQSIY